VTPVKSLPKHRALSRLNAKGQPLSSTRHSRAKYFCRSTGDRIDPMNTDSIGRNWWQRYVPPASHCGEGSTGDKTALFPDRVHAKRMGVPSRPGLHRDGWCRVVKPKRAQAGRVVVRESDLRRRSSAPLLEGGNLAPAWDWCSQPTLSSSTSVGAHLVVLVTADENRTSYGPNLACIGFIPADLSRR